MEIVCIILDLTGKVVESTWQDYADSQGFTNQVIFLKNPEEVQKIFNGAIVAPLVIHAQEVTPELKSVLRSYQAAFGPMADFQAIVNSNPDPMFMAGVFEFGLEQFFADESWTKDTVLLCKSISEKLSNQDSPEYKTLNLVVTLRGADANQIAQAKAEMGDLASYDFRAAFASGRVEEASGNYDEAIKAFRSATGMNKMYRPVSTSLGEACLLTGKIDEAIEIFQKLDKTNPKDVDRKASLASAFIEKGDFETASKYAAEAEAISPGSSRVSELKAQVLLSQGKVGDAFVLMDQMSDVGPFFAAKLNDLGIKLSQSGKGKSALSLYNKAHKIVRPELRYKISLNSALACRKLGEYDAGLKYVARCAKEFGSMFPKLQKIKEAMINEQSEQVGKNISDESDDSKMVG